MKKDDDDEPNVWVTVIKLILGATVIIGGTGLALWYVNKNQGPPDIPPPSSWGISQDNPLRPRK